MATGNCAKCGAINFYHTASCDECGARLPWADELHASRERELIRNDPQKSVTVIRAPGAQVKVLEPDTPATLAGYALLSALMSCIGLPYGLFMLTRNVPRGLVCIIGALLPIAVFMLLRVA